MRSRSKSTSAPLSDVKALRGILDAVTHPIFVKDEQMRFVVVNETMCRLMGQSFETLIGKQDKDFVPPEQADVFRRNDVHVLSTGEVNENEELFSDGKGNLRTIVTRKKRLVLSDGALLLVGCITDITDFRRAEALIRHHADHDPLTGLANRRVFSQEIQRALARVDRADACCALLLLDLDFFKPINDTFGHATGDKVLCETAARLSNLVRKGDTVARLGGDEFAVISESHPGSEDPKDAARRLAARLVTGLAKPITADSGQVQVSASIGIAQCPCDGRDADTLLRCADAAMYRAKQAGRGRFRFFQQGTESGTRPRRKLKALTAA
jgi:diguanylate cyclase (GGDEF)-like protein/PAS domain S-box-containing protein